MSHNIEIESYREEITGWTRRIYLDFDGKRAYVPLYYNEGDGYDYGTPDTEGEWTDEERNTFFEWLRSYDNLAELDDLTSFINA